MTFETIAPGLSTSGVTFEESLTFYPYITALEDESFELDLPLYLQKALVYYVKAKLAEDAGEFEMKEYFMREYKKITERNYRKGSKFSFGKGESDWNFNGNYWSC